MERRQKGPPKLNKQKVGDAEELRGLTSEAERRRGSRGRAPVTVAAAAPQLLFAPQTSRLTHHQRTGIEVSLYICTRPLSHLTSARNPRVRAVTLSRFALIGICSREALSSPPFLPLGIFCCYCEEVRGQLWFGPLLASLKFFQSHLSNTQISSLRRVTKFSFLLLAAEAS